MKCSFQKKNGKRCSADSQVGKTVCVFHDPGKAADGRRARRAGGVSRTRTKAVLPLTTLDSPLATGRDVCGLLAETINQVRKGQIDARIANTIGFLAGILLKGLDQRNIEDRLCQLESTLVRDSAAPRIFEFVPPQERTE